MIDWGHKFTEILFPLHFKTEFAYFMSGELSNIGNSLQAQLSLRLSSRWQGKHCCSLDRLNFEIYHIRMTLMQILIMVMARVIDCLMMTYQQVLISLVVSYRVVKAVKMSHNWPAKPSCYHGRGLELHFTHTCSPCIQMYIIIIFILIYIISL